MITETTTDKMYQGDRIIIKNIPPNAPWRNNYWLKIAGSFEGVIDLSLNNQVGIKEVTTDEVMFYTGYPPYKDKRFSVSGFSHCIDRHKLRFVKRWDAVFWKWENGIAMSGNTKQYYEEVNYFECDVKDIK